MARRLRPDQGSVSRRLHQVRVPARHALTLAGNLDGVISDEVAWCEIENAGYTADLDYGWASAARSRSTAPRPPPPAPGPCSSSAREWGGSPCGRGPRCGRLGSRSQQELLDEVARRARAMGVETITPIRGDARLGASLGRRFELVIAPQVFVQLFEARADRAAIMAFAARHLAPSEGSSFWMTFHPDLEPAWADEADAPFPVQATKPRRAHLRGSPTRELLAPRRGPAIASDRLVASGRW